MSDMHIGKEGVARSTARPAKVASGVAKKEALGTDRLSLGRTDDDVVLRTDYGSFVSVKVPPSRSGMGIAWDPKVVAMRQKGTLNLS